MAGPTAKFTVTTDFLAATFDGWSKSKPGSAPGAAPRLKKAEWAFGDGSTLVVNQPTGKPPHPDWTPTHVYASAGTWNVQLKVTDSTNASHTAYGTVRVLAPPPPNRWFTFAAALLAVSFVGDSGSGSWTFGDGGTATGTSPTYTYAAPGTYSVTYTVSGISATRLVTVVNAYRPAPLAELLRLEVQQDPGEVFPWNRLTNPSGRTGTAGWSTPHIGSKVTSSPPGLKYTAGPKDGEFQVVYSEAVRVIPGRYVVAGCQFLGLNAGYVVMRCEILNSAGLSIANAQTAYLSTPGAVVTAPLKVPPAGRFARLTAYMTRNTVDWTTSLAGDWWRWTQAFVASSLYQSLVQNLPYREGQTWIDVLPSAHQIDITRVELDASSLTATLFDAALDPSMVGIIRSGARCRLSVDTNQGGTLVREPLFTGRISDVAVAYGPTLVDDWTFESEQLVPNPTMKTNLDTWGTDLLGAYTTFTSTADGGRITVTNMPNNTSSWGPYIKVPVRDYGGGGCVIKGEVKDLTTGLNGNRCCRLKVRAFDATDTDLGDVLIAGSTDKPVWSGTNGFAALFTFNLGATPPGTVALNVYIMSVNVSGATTSYQQAFTDFTVTDLYSVPGAPKDPKAAKITVTAEDDLAILAATKQPNTVATVADLPELLEGARVPFVVNGSADQVPAATVVAVNDSASVLDQIVVARDNDNGIAWMSRGGVLTAWTVPPGIVDETWQLRDTDYTDIDSSYDTQDVTNSLLVKWLHLVSGETVEDTYGPYQNPDSILKYGLRQTEITYAGTSDAVIAARAAAFLANNSTPRRTVETLTLPIRYASDLEPRRALLELGSVLGVRTQYPADLIGLRVKEIKHSIVATSDGVKWDLTLGFKAMDGAARSIVVPSPPPGLAVGLPFGMRTGDATGGTPTQTLTTGTITKVTLLSKDIGVQGGVTWSNNEWTVTKPGIYLVGCRVAFAGNTTGTRTVYFYVNGTQTSQLRFQPGASSSGGSFTDSVRLNSGDKVDMRAWQNSGGNLDLVNNAGNCGFSIVYQGA